MMLHRHFEDSEEERRKNLTTSEKPKDEFVSEVFPPEKPKKSKKSKD